MPAKMIRERYLDWKDAADREDRAEGIGIRVVRVRITPLEFIEYCDGGKRLPYNTANLYNLASEKWRREAAGQR